MMKGKKFLTMIKRMWNSTVTMKTDHNWEKIELLAVVAISETELPCPYSRSLHLHVVEQKEMIKFNLPVLSLSSAVLRSLD